MGREKQEEQLQMGMFDTAEAVQTEAPETDAVLPRMKELVATLDEAARAYYAEGREIMSNFEYDALYDELAALESQTGVILAGSPTQRVGYEVMTELPKERRGSGGLCRGAREPHVLEAGWTDRGPDLPRR